MNLLYTKIRIQWWRFLKNRSWQFIAAVMLLTVGGTTFLISRLYSLSPFLDGVPQFVLASINALITSSQANYVLALDKNIRKIKDETNATTNKRHILAWTLLLSGFFTLTVAALLAIARILMGSWPVITPSWLDTLIVVATGWGYLWLAITALFAWLLPSSTSFMQDPREWNWAETKGTQTEQKAEPVSNAHRSTFSES